LLAALVVERDPADAFSGIEVLVRSV
jgi:hypothetical protein